MNQLARVLTITAFTLAAVLPGTAAAASVNVKTAVKDNAIELGQATSLRISITGLTGQERADGTLIVRAAKFPYRSYKPIGKIPSPWTRERFTISPQTNTRIQVVFSAGTNIQLSSRPVTIYVNPIVRGGGTVDSRRGTRYLPGSITFPRSVLSRWRKTPKQVRNVYYYQQCEGTSYYRLRARKPIRVTVGNDRMRINMPGFMFTFKACGGKAFWPLGVAQGKFPGYLRNGDDGVGVPSPNARLYKRWLKLAGRKRVPARLLDPIFYR